MNYPSDIWILAGQSNMQGCGLLQGQLVPDERVWNFSSAGQWEIGCEPLHRLWESFTPIQQQILRGGVVEAEREQSNEFFAAREAQSRVSGAGLGLAFGQAMAEHTGNPVGLIAAAHGGTTLAQWDFRLRDAGGHSLYGAMMERVRRALQNGGQVRGVLWYQGESDATPDSAATYGARLKQWIEALRHDLNAPQLPVILAQIGGVVRALSVDPAQGWQAKPWMQIRQALLEIPDQVPHTSVTATIDLGLVDAIHIDTPGLIRLGRRMARLAQGENSPRVVELKQQGWPLGLGAAILRCEGVTGGWLPRRHIGGFQVCDAQGEPHPHFCMINASADENDPRHIRLIFNAPLDDTAFIGYGMGLNPYCNAADEADMPLCTFAPLAAS